jgi:hypothetical protein
MGLFVACKSRQEKLKWISTLDDQSVDRIWRAVVDGVIPVKLLQDSCVSSPDRREPLKTKCFGGTKLLGF